MSVSPHILNAAVVLLPPLSAGAGAIWLLLPRPVGRNLFLGCLLGVAALALTGIRIIPVSGAPTIETVLFYAFSALAVVSGTLLVTQQHPGRAALSFALVVLSVSGLFVLLAAPFLMAASIIIYAGAIVVTFLFVLMLAQQNGRDNADVRSAEPLLTSLTAFVFLGGVLYILQLGFGDGPKDLDVFLERIHAAQAQPTAQKMNEVLNPKDEVELNDAVERLRQDNGNKLKPEELTNILKDADFSSRLRAALKMLGETDLANRTVNKPADFNWPNAEQPDAAEKMRTVLKNYETLVLTGQQQAGLLSPDVADARYISNQSGPSPALAADLRRDEWGRPQAPAENAAYLGKGLFTDYLLPVELGGFLLLIAVVAAIAIAHRQSASGRLP